MDKRSVAIIEDDVDLLSSYADILTDKYALVLFSHPKEFLDYVEKTPSLPFSAIISDYSMPQINGVEMVKSLRQHKVDIPVILISAYLTKENIVEGVDTGVLKFIDKPFEIQDISQALDEVVTDYEIKRINHQIGEISQQLQELTAAFKVIFESHFDDQYLSQMFMPKEGDSQGMGDTLTEIQSKYQRLLDVKKYLEERKQAA